MRKEFLYGTLALGLVFTACKSDDLTIEENNGNGVAETAQTLYVKMAIKGGNQAGTRAAADNGNPVEGTDFDPGQGESEVQNAYFVFYDNNGNVVGDYVEVTLKDPTTAATPGGTVEKYYQSVVSVGIRKGENNPTQVVCYINPTTPVDLTKPLYEIQTVTRQAVTRNVNGATIFPMSNSVYYGAEGTAAPTIAVPINSDQLYDSKEDAEASDAKTIEVYVERYAAKLAFSYKDVNPFTTSSTVYAADGSSTAPEVVLTFVPERWALNAEANETFVIKSFRLRNAAGGIMTDNYTFAAANEAINGTGGNWAWNNASYHRSYWACSPAYFTAEYPEVASDIDPTVLHQKYYNYEELAAGAGFEAGNTTAQYFKETTVGRDALESENPQAAVASVILVGHYELTVDGGNAVKSAFYTYSRGKSTEKPGVYFPAQAGTANSTVAGGGSMMMRFLQELTCLYKLENGVYTRFNPNNAADLATLVGALEIKRPDADVIGDMKVPSRYLTLQLTGTGLANIYVANGDGYKAIGDGANQISLTEANQVIMQQVQFCNYYASTEDATAANAGGKAYFNIPVLHYGWYRASNGHTATSKIDWNNLQVGDLGIVRNHSYSVNVTAIKGLGTAISDYEAPIVPPADTKEQYVSYKVNILKWAVVPAQNVEL
ncbi:MAG: fimbria major subunit [Muribaculaceae bacterium]|nr:fimbria major subunit [Muribaculaceae bacterium]